MIWWEKKKTGMIFKYISEFDYSIFWKSLLFRVDIVPMEIFMEYMEIYRIIKLLRLFASFVRMQEKYWLQVNKILNFEWVRESRERKDSVWLWNSENVSKCVCVCVRERESEIGIRWEKITISCVSKVIAIKEQEKGKNSIK